VLIPPYGNFLVAAFPFLLGYSVLKYKLFNMKTITAELIAFALWVFTLIITFLAESTMLKLVYGFFMVLMGIGGAILIKAVYKTEKLSEEKSEFMSFASHQVKGPLTNFKSATSMILQGDFGPISPEMRATIQGLYRSTSQAIPMVQAFLDSSKLEQEGGMKYQMERCDIKQLIEEVTREEKFSAEEKDIVLSFIATDIGSFVIRGDIIKLKQVFFNLIDNAIKYTQAGGVSVILEKRNGNILFSVHDTGVGIAEDAMPRLFKKFSRAADSQKINVSSNGLGLYLASEFVKAHSGKIWAESEGAGKGAAFFVELPVK